MGLAGLTFTQVVLKCRSKYGLQQQCILVSHPTLTSKEVTGALTTNHHKKTT